MTRSIIETILGALVLIVAGIFLVFSYKTANMGQADGMEITADFSGIGGLGIGDEVQISGVKIGTITNVELSSETYLARVFMNVDPDIELPIDTAAIIGSESLMGGKYLALEPGAEEDFLESGDRVQYTQAPQNLEQLLGKFIFSMQNDPKK